MLFKCTLRLNMSHCLPLLYQSSTYNYKYLPLIMSRPCTLLLRYLSATHAAALVSDGSLTASVYSSGAVDGKTWREDEWLAVLRALTHSNMSNPDFQETNRQREELVMGVHSSTLEAFEHQKRFAPWKVHSQLHLKIGTSVVYTGSAEEEEGQSDESSSGSEGDLEEERGRGKRKRSESVASSSEEESVDLRRQLDDLLDGFSSDSDSEEGGSSESGDGSGRDNSVGGQSGGESEGEWDEDPTPIPTHTPSRTDEDTDSDEEEEGGGAMEDGSSQEANGGEEGNEHVDSACTEEIPPLSSSTNSGIANMPAMSHESSQDALILADRDVWGLLPVYKEWCIRRRSYRRGLEDGMFTLSLMRRLNRLLDSEEEALSRYDALQIKLGVKCAVAAPESLEGVSTGDTTTTPTDDINPPPPQHSIQQQLGPGRLYNVALRTCVVKPGDECSVHDWLAAYVGFVTRSYSYGHCVSIPCLENVENTDREVEGDESENVAVGNGSVGGGDVANPPPSQQTPALTSIYSTVLIDGCITTGSSGNTVAVLTPTPESCLCGFCGMSERMLCSQFVYTFTRQEWNHWHAQKSSTAHSIPIVVSSLFPSGGGTKGATGGTSSAESSTAAEMNHTEMWLPVHRPDALFVCVSLGVTEEQFNTAYNNFHVQTSSVDASADPSPQQSSTGGIFLRVQLTSLVTVDLLCGSVLAHETCAEILHTGRNIAQTRIDQVKQVQIWGQSMEMMKEEAALCRRAADVLCGLPCGKTISAGRDHWGCVYYLLPGCRALLTCCRQYNTERDADSEREGGGAVCPAPCDISIGGVDVLMDRPSYHTIWKMYTNPTDIAEVLGALAVAVETRRETGWREWSMDRRVLEVLQKVFVDEWALAQSMCMTKVEPVLLSSTTRLDPVPPPAGGGGASAYSTRRVRLRGDLVTLVTRRSPHDSTGEDVDGGDGLSVDPDLMAFMREASGKPASLTTSVTDSGSNASGSPTGSDVTGGGGEKISMMASCCVDGMSVEGGGGGAVTDSMEETGAVDVDKAPPSDTGIRQKRSRPDGESEGEEEGGDRGEAASKRSNTSSSPGMAADNTTTHAGHGSAGDSAPVGGAGEAGGASEDVLLVGARVFVCTAEEQFVEGQIISIRVQPAHSGEEEASVRTTAGTAMETMYRIRFRGWGVEHDNWVTKDALAAADSQSRSILQGDPSQGLKTTNQLDVGLLPPVLDTLHAYRYYKSPSRHHTHINGGATPSHTPIPFLYDNTSELTVLKAALLMMYHALPYGAVDESEERWGRGVSRMGSGGYLPLAQSNTPFSSAWMHNTCTSSTPVQLMESEVMLEHAVKSTWLRPTGTKLLGCLPSRSHAVRHATYGSVAVRLWCFDQAIRYDKVVVPTGDSEDEEEEGAEGPVGDSKTSRQGGGSGGSSRARSGTATSSNKRRSAAKKRR